MTCLPYLLIHPHRGIIHNCRSWTVTIVTSTHIQHHPLHCQGHLSDCPLPPTPLPPLYLPAPAYVSIPHSRTGLTTLLKTITCCTIDPFLTRQSTIPHLHWCWFYPKISASGTSWSRPPHHPHISRHSTSLWLSEKPCMHLHKCGEALFAGAWSILYAAGPVYQSGVCKRDPGPFSVLVFRNLLGLFSFSIPRCICTRTNELVAIAQPFFTPSLSSSGLTPPASFPTISVLPLHR